MEGLPLFLKLTIPNCYLVFIAIFFMIERQIDFDDYSTEQVKELALDPWVIKLPDLITFEVICFLKVREPVLLYSKFISFLNVNLYYLCVLVIVLPI